MDYGKKACEKMHKGAGKNVVLINRLCELLEEDVRITELCANIIGGSQMCAFYETLNLAPS
jgi:hypothetical protein